MNTKRYFAFQVFIDISLQKALVCVLLDSFSIFPLGLSQGQP